jgi:flagellar motor switch/type III secretory pathway protein FliN
MEDLIRTLELEITVDLGEANLTLGEIADLSSGDVVTLDRLADGPHLMRAGGQPWAWVDLIELDGQWAARVRSLVHQPSEGESGEMSGEAASA